MKNYFWNHLKMKNLQKNRLIISILLFSIFSVNSNSNVINTPHLLAKSAKIWFAINENKLIFKSENSLRSEFNKLVDALQLKYLDEKILNDVFMMVKKLQKAKLLLLIQPVQPVYKKQTKFSKKISNIPFKYG